MASLVCVGPCGEGRYFIGGMFYVAGARCDRPLSIPRHFSRKSWTRDDVMSTMRLALTRPSTQQQPHLITCNLGTHPSDLGLCLIYSACPSLSPSHPSLFCVYCISPSLSALSLPPQLDGHEPRLRTGRRSVSARSERFLGRGTAGPTRARRDRVRGGGPVLAAQDVVNSCFDRTLGCHNR